MDEHTQVGAYDIIAVDEKQAANMKKAVVDYKAKLDEQLDLIQKIDAAAYTVGFKGKQVDTIKSYIDASVDEMKKMSNFISEFEVAIDKVIANYTQRSETITTNSVEAASVAGEGDLAGVNEFGE